jgi:hypothetical protein
VSEKGNYYLNVEGYNLTIFQKADNFETCWSFLIKNRFDGNTRFARRKYSTLESAKQGTLTALVWAKDTGL